MKNLILLLLFLIPVFLIGQTVTVSESLTIRNDKAYYLLGKQKDRFLLLREKPNDIEIQAFDERMRMSWNKEIILDKKNPELIDVLPGKDEFNLIYKFRKKGHLVVKIHKYDPAAQMTDSITIVDYGSLFYAPIPKVVYSEDKRKLLVYYYEKQTTLHLTSFDLNSMEVLWSNTIALDEAFIYKDFQQLILTNDGTFFLVSGKDNRKAKKEEHRYEIIQCTGESELTTFTVFMQGYLTYDIYFSFDNLNNQLVAGGLYSDKNRGRAQGYFYMRIPPNNPDAHQLAYEPFDPEFIATLSEKDVDKEKGLTDIDVQEIVLRKDGGILLVAERSKEFERRIAATGRGYIGQDGGRYIVDYYYEDIFILSIHPDGKLHWKTILHKKQYSQDDGAAFSSYFLLKTPSNLRFLFNDEIRHENSVSEYVIEGTGNSDRNAVMNTESQEIRLRFREGLQVAANEFVVPSERRHRLKLVKVTY